MGSDSLQSSFWLMVAIQTIGSVDLPGVGERKMPAPRQYVAIVVTWLVLNLMAGIGAGAQRAATALGWLVVLTGMVAGPFGQQVTSLFQTVATRYSTANGNAISTALSGGTLPTVQPSSQPSVGIAPGAPQVNNSGNILGG
jgi:hypothetical protein